MKKTLAIFSPNQNAYSETFIQAHKKLPFEIRFYYDGYLPTKLEGGASLIDFTFRERVEKKINKRFNLRQHALIYSLKRENVDCVLAEYGPSACESLEVLKFLKLPLIVHFHGYDTSVNSLLQIYGQTYKEVFKYANAVIAVSIKMKKALLDLGCPEEKIVISTYGPDPDFAGISPKYNGAQFIAVGRFVEKKAPHLTIIAFGKVIDKFPEAKLIMVGDGELLPICKDLVRALNLTEYIEFKGVQTAKQIQSLFEESIAFVQHSITAVNGDSEGTPVAILEAQAAGLPVISTFHAGIPDVVINEVTGLLVIEHDVNGMTNNMVQMLCNNALTKKMGQAGKENIKKNFTLKRHLKLLEKAVNKSLV